MYRESRGGCFLQLQPDFQELEGACGVGLQGELSALVRPAIRDLVLVREALHVLRGLLADALQVRRVVLQVLRLGRRVGGLS